MRTKTAMLLGVALLLGAGFAAACSSSDTDDLEKRLDAVEAQLGSDQSGDMATMVQNLAIVSAVSALDGASLHAVDESVNDNGEIPGGAAGPINRAILAMQVAAWPDELKGDADALLATLQELVAALETEDPAQVGPVASDAHEAQHLFADTATEHVLASLGIESEGDGHDAGGQTPAAGETPADHMEEGG